MLTVQSGPADLGKEFDRDARQAVFVVVGQRLHLTPSPNSVASEN